jgi:hypothetical protein
VEFNWFSVRSPARYLPSFLPSDAVRKEKTNSPFAVAQADLDLSRRFVAVHFKLDNPPRRIPTARTRTRTRQRSGHLARCRGRFFGEGRPRSEAVTGTGKGSLRRGRLPRPGFGAAFGDPQLDGLVVFDFEERDRRATTPSPDSNARNFNVSSTWLRVRCQMEKNPAQGQRENRTETYPA